MSTMNTTNTLSPAAHAALHDQSWTPFETFGAASPLVMRSNPAPRVLLVDDDPLFGKVMQRVAANLHVPLTYVRSLQDLGDPTKQRFDVALLDYDLGSVTGVELAEYFEHIAQPMPVILISETTRTKNRRWSESIRDFVHKGLGPFAIMDAAFEAHEVAQIHAKMRQRAVKSH
jgi:CheY-like chemotaxis protein